MPGPAGLQVRAGEHQDDGQHGRRPACGAGERVPGAEEDERHEDEAEQRGRPRESERADTERQRHRASVASQTSHSTPRSAAATA